MANIIIIKKQPLQYFLDVTLCLPRYSYFSFVCFYEAIVAYKMSKVSNCRQAYCFSNILVKMKL